MTDPATIFQRTHSGREEIHNKSHGLTQSERLVLIMVDGVSSAKEIRAKLPVLSDERFERALQKLQAKELVLEVFMPLDDQTPEELERNIIDRFLQQDPMDPVTIMLRDPDDELGMLEEIRRMPPRVEPVPAAIEPDTFPLLEPQHERNVEPVTNIPELSEPMPEVVEALVASPNLDAEDVRAADALNAELRAKWQNRPAPVVANVPPQPMPEPVMRLEHQDVSPFAVHWGYWLIVAGLSFILGFVLARATA